MKILNIVSVIIVASANQITYEALAMDEDGTSSGIKRSALNTHEDESPAKKAKNKIIDEIRNKLGVMNDIDPTRIEDVIKLIEESSLYRQFLLEFKKDIKSSNGGTPLHLAAQNGHLEVVRLLSLGGAPIDAKTTQGATPLHLAAQKGYLEVVSLLLSNRAPIDVKTTQGHTPLHIAAENGHLEVVRLLLYNKAPIDAKTTQGYTPLHCAAQNGHLEVVRLLSLGGAPIDAQIDQGHTPLHIAAQNGHLEVVRLLLSNRAPIEAKTTQGYTPLHCAAQNGHLEVVRLLSLGGAPIDAQIDQGHTPLHLAAQNGHLEVVRLLLYNKAPIDAKTTQGYTPLHCAAQNGHLEVVRLLLYNKAPIDAKTTQGYTPLHLAAQNGHLEVVRLLLYNKAPIDAQIDQGHTPLHLAAQNGHLEVVRLLLYNKAPIDAKTTQGYTPLHIAAEQGHLEVVSLLLYNRAPIDAKTTQGYTPLHCAAQNGHLEVVRLLLSRVLLSYRAPIDAKTTQGYTPLHIAAGYGFYHIAKLLIESGANINNIVHGSSILDSVTEDKTDREGKQEFISFLKGKGAFSSAEPQARAQRPIVPGVSPSFSLNQVPNRPVVAANRPFDEQPENHQFINVQMVSPAQHQALVKHCQQLSAQNQQLSMKCNSLLSMVTELQKQQEVQQTQIDELKTLLEQRFAAPMQGRRTSPSSIITIKEEDDFALKERKHQHAKFLSKLSEVDLENAMKVIRGMSTASKNCVHLAREMIQFLDTSNQPKQASEDACTLDDWTSVIDRHRYTTRVKREAGVPFTARVGNAGSFDLPLMPIGYLEKENGVFEAYAFNLTGDENFVLPGAPFKDLPTRLNDLADSETDDISYGLVNLSRKRKDHPGHMFVYFKNQNGLFFIDGQKIVKGEGKAIFKDLEQEYQEDQEFIKYAVFLTLYPK